MTTATATAQPSVALSFGDVLRITVVRRVFYAQVVSLFGDFLALFAVIAVVSFRMHGTPAQLTGLQIAYILPIVFVGPIAGVFVDRWPIKPTLITSDLLRAGLALLLIPATSFWQVYAVLAALSCVSAFFGPAQTVTIRSHVPIAGLMSANALMQIAFMGSRIVGPATAGVIVAKFTPQACYAIDVASFLISASLIASVAFVRPASLRPPCGSSNTRIHATRHDLQKRSRSTALHTPMTTTGSFSPGKPFGVLHAHTCGWPPAKGRPRDTAHFEAPYQRDAYQHSSTTR